MSWPKGKPRLARGLTVSPYAHPFMRVVSERMVATGTTLAALAKRSGLDPATIGAWASGKQQPTMLYFGWVADALNMELKLCYTVSPLRTSVPASSPAKAKLSKRRRSSTTSSSGKSSGRSDTSAVEAGPSTTITEETLP